MSPVRPESDSRRGGLLKATPARAETALSVEELIAAAAAARLRRIVGAVGMRDLNVVEFTCGVDNQAMRRLGERFAAELELQGDQITGRLVP